MRTATNTIRSGASAPLALLACLVLLAAVLLGGCAQPRQWTKGGLSQAEFDRDAAGCRREAARAAYRDPFAAAAGQDQDLERSVAEERMFEQCMFAKGYRLEKSKSGR